MPGPGGIVVAAGSGERLRADVPKALVRVAGMTLVAHAAARMRAAGVIELVVVAPAGHEDAVRAAVAEQVADAVIVTGGAARSDSVRAGLRALDPGCAIVAVHDAARALTPPAVIAGAIAAVTGDVVAAAPAVAIADTLKRVDGDVIVATVDRAELVAVQTPQVFRRDVLEQAHRGGGDATDDLALVEALAPRGRIVVTAGAAEAMKITYPQDLAVAEALVAAARA